MDIYNHSLNVTEGQSLNKIDQEHFTNIEPHEHDCYKDVSLVTPALTIPEMEKVRKGVKKKREKEKRRKIKEADFLCRCYTMCLGSQKGLTVHRVFEGFRVFGGIRVFNPVGIGEGLVAFFR